MPKSKTFLLIFVFSIFLLAFLAVRKSFDLALGGDDWGIHLLIWGIFDVRKEASYWNPFTYFCTYCPHYFFLSIISRVFGYEHFYYFLANFLARVTASFALFFLIKTIIKSKLAAVLASSFFAITYLGIEATDWAFNYNYFLGIALMCILIICYWKAKQTSQFKYSLISSLLVAASAIIAPARMHGLIPLLLIAEIAWWVIEGKKFNLKISVIRITLASIVYYIILYGVSDLYIYLRDKFGFEIGPYFIGNGYGAKEWNSSRVQEGINFISTKISQGHSDLIIDPIATLGNYIMPDRLWAAFPFLSNILIVSLIMGGFTFFVLYCAGIHIKKGIIYFINLFVWTIFIYYLQKINMDTFTQPRVAFSLVGGFSSIFSIWLFFLLKKNRPTISHMFIFSFGWMNTFTFFPWIIGPYGIISSWGRYSIQQAAGLAIWMAIIFLICISELNKKRKFVLLGTIYMVIAFFVFMHIKFANDYLNHVATYRNREIDKKFWSYITKEVTSLDKNNQNIFLMLTDRESAEIAEAIRFGFYGRASIHYQVPSFQNYPFMVVNEYENILSSVYDGKYLTKQGRKPIPTTIDRIYVFALQNKEIYNVTDQIREKLKTDLEALNKGTLSLPQTFQ